MRTRVCALLVMVLAAVALVLPQSATATQTWCRLALSRNGHHWSADLHRPLFAHDVLLIPGSERTSEFYVRNQSGERAALAVSVRAGRHHGLLARESFRLAVRAAGGWQRVVRTDGRPTLRLDLAKGAVQPIAVRVRLLPQARNATQHGRADFTLEVRLSQKNGTRA